MSSLSSFDDLLSELDAPATAEKPQEDPLRGDCLRRLVEASKAIEKIAQVLDPSEKKHPLFGQTVPAAERAQLKGVVGRLMQKQKELQQLEETLLAPTQEPTPRMEGVPSSPSPSDPIPAPAAEPRPEPASEATTTSPHEEMPAPPRLEPTPPVPVPAAAPDPERVAFEAYKHQWETVFADDPAQRLAHPEVAAYYQQMEAYFAQKQTHEQNTA